MKKHPARVTVFHRGMRLSNARTISVSAVTVIKTTVPTVLI